MDIFSTHNTTMYTPNWDSQDRICSAFVLPANTNQSTHETTQRMSPVDTRFATHGICIPLGKEIHLNAKYETVPDLLFFEK